jgi:DNA modification methylase
MTFREVRRVLRSDGTLWLNLGDSYARAGGTQGGGNREMMPMEGTQRRMTKLPAGSNLKSKDLIGIPWRVAFALQADGWYLRQDIVWSKPNPMPESVTDRCTKSHEYIFMFSKSEKYYFDYKAIMEPAICGRLRGSGPMSALGTGRGDAVKSDKQSGHGPRHAGFDQRWRERTSATSDELQGKTADRQNPAFRTIREMRRKRDVWVIPTRSFKGAHFATFPPDLVTPCILAGCPEGGTVLDPFAGAGTTGMVANSLGRSAVLIELNPEYAQMAADRINAVK